MHAAVKTAVEKEQRRGREAIPELEACIAFTAYGLWRKERNCNTECITRNATANA